MPVISFYGHQITITVAKGTLLIDAVRAASFPIDAPCGGHGKCGKCKVSVLNGKLPGIHPACSFPVTEDLTIRLPGASEGSRILETGRDSGTDPETVFLDGMKKRFREPLIRTVNARIPACPIGEALSECQCVRQALGTQTEIPLSVAASLHRRLEEFGRRGNFVLCGDRLLSIRREDAPVYVLAFDIGTTTVVSYLLNGKTGRQVSVSSVLNPQTAYGGDVISRSEYDVSHGDGKLTARIRAALRSLTEENCEKAGIASEDICFAAIVGNTCMQHLYLGVSPESLLCAPYTATVDELQLLPAASLGLPIHPEAQAAVFPSVAGFVGGDTVGVLLSLEESALRELTLILDIGTNGELVLAKGDVRYTCSTSAGPAFEGARIRCGMRGAAGAVDRAFLENGELHITTIGGLPPAGICGSGLIDLICCLLELKILSPRGRMNPSSKWPEHTAALYGHRFTKKDGITAFLLTDDPDGVFLTQKDVREVQLAKSAIAAGIESLCEAMGVSPSDIRSVLLAGAFGNYLSPKSACRIGLIPPVLLDRIQGIGNAAGEGAKLAALACGALEAAERLARDTRFLELATLPGFQDAYLSHLNF